MCKLGKRKFTSASHRLVSADTAKHADVECLSATHSLKMFDISGNMSEPCWSGLQNINKLPVLLNCIKIKYTHHTHILESCGPSPQNINTQSTNLMYILESCWPSPQNIKHCILCDQAVLVHSLAIPCCTTRHRDQ